MVGADGSVYVSQEERMDGFGEFLVVNQYRMFTFNYLILCSHDILSFPTRPSFNVNLDKHL